MVNSYPSNMPVTKPIAIHKRYFRIKSLSMFCSDVLIKAMTLYGSYPIS